MSSSSSSSSSFLYTVLFITIPFSSLFSTSSAQKCLTQTFSNKQLYTHCNDLSSLDASLHYTYDPAHSTLSLAFLARPAKPDGWVAWALNPTDTGMVGSQALVAFKDSGKLTVKTYNITSYSQSLFKESKVWYEVKEASAEESDGVMRLFATVVLPERGGGGGVLNQVWQVGGSVTNGVPDKHEFGEGNLNSKGSLDLLKGESSGSTGVDSRTKRRNIHGILNALSWGILFPLGVILARYMRTFPSADPAWFYLHVSCQMAAYILGVTGWGTGLKLGSESKGIVHTYHRGIGIALFCLATVQIFALFLRPGKDHKYRLYWNIYHHSVGYSIVVLGIINVFKGLDILIPDKKWRSTYIGIIVALGVIAALLEVITWIVVLRRKSSRSTKPYDENGNN